MVPPAEPSWIDHVTAALEAFATTAVNVCDCPTVNAVAPGVKLIATGACDDPHPDTQRTGTRIKQAAKAVPRLASLDRNSFQSMIAIRSSPRSMLLHAIRTRSDRKSTRLNSSHPSI